jgi:hypothetical protein
MFSAVKALIRAWFPGLALIAPLFCVCAAGLAQPAGEEASKAPPILTSLASGEEEAAPNLKAGVLHLHLPGSPNYLLVDDFDGNGRLDLALTSHAGNLSRIYFQREPRQWQAGPVVTEVGFHPGELLRVPAEGDVRRYIMFAEGEAKLLVMSPTGEGGLSVAAQAYTQFPRSGAWFRWPGWGLGLAVAPFRQPAIMLAKNFQPTTAGAEDTAALSFTPAYAMLEQVAAADLDGDGADEILFVPSGGNQLWVIRYPGADAQPSSQVLWTFPRGVRARFVIPADIDQDGDMDLIVPDETERPGGSETTALNILINDGSGGWQPHCVPIPTRTRAKGGMTGIRGFAFGVDQDGLGYALAAGYERLTLIQFPSGWDGESHTLRQIALGEQTAMPAAAIQDLDGDGWLDAVLAGGIGDMLGGIVIHGPLWKNFAFLDAEDLVTPITHVGGDEAGMPPSIGVEAPIPAESAAE